MTMLQAVFTSFYMRLSCLLAVFILAGCSTTPDDQEGGPVFYPPLPNPPRIQHLLSLTTMDDLNQSSSGFADFILGEKSADELVVKPYGIAAYAGKIYVVDAGRAGYLVIDLAKRKYDFFDGGASGRMRKPINITIDKDGTKYISDTGRDQVIAFDRNDNYVRAFGVKGQFKPSDTAIAGNRLFITDLNSHKIHVVDKRNGKPLYDFGKVGSKDGEFYFPTNLAVSPDKHLYVTDTGNFRVQKFTYEGKFVRRYGSIGSSFGKFARPKGLTLDREGHLYVVDAAFENVQLIDNDGKLLLFFGHSGDKPADINLPADIYIDYDNIKYFQAYADPKFKLEYLILVSSQFGVNKINIFGFGRMQGMEYPETDKQQLTTKTD